MSEGGFRVTRWKWTETLSEGAILRYMEEEGLYTYHWTNSPGDTYSVHSHPYHKVIYVIRGSITFSVSESGDEVVLYSGDRLDLPAGVTHEARVGPQGVACLEGHHET